MLRRFVFLRPFFFLAFIFFVFPSFSVAGDSVNDEITAPHVEGEVLVKFKRSINLSMISGKASLNSFAFVQGLTRSDVLTPQNISVMESKRGESTEQLIERLEDDTRIEYVEPNYVRKIFVEPDNTRVVPDDPGVNLQWGIDNSGQEILGVKGKDDSDIDAPEAWKIFSGYSVGTGIGTGAGSIVAVLDTGLDLTHPDFDGVLWDGSTGCKDESGATVSGGCPNHGWDFVNNDNDPSDDHGHGTHVASILGSRGNNKEGISGVHWKTRIMALKVADSDGFISSENWIKALNFARQNGAKVVNASFGGGEFSQAEQDALKSFEGIFVAAVGNKGIDVDVIPNYPSGYPEGNIIAVAASDSSDRLASFSNFGVKSVDVVAPGSSVLGAIPGGEYAFLSGTSMATPYVSGLAVLLWDYAPQLNVAQVISDIVRNGDSIPDFSSKVSSGKRINALNTLKALTVKPSLVSTLLLDDGISGRGVLGVKFTVEDSLGSVPFSLKQFEYSVDGGTTFVAPTNDDLSTALRSSLDGVSWISNSYVTSFSGSSPLQEYTFFADFNHTDFSAFTSPLQVDVRIRFKVDGIIGDSDFIVSSDVVPPIALLSDVPSGFVNKNSMTIAVSGDTITKYAYTLDGASRSDFFDVTTPLSLKDLLDGPHILSVVAKDVLGNVQFRPTIAKWSVDATAPIGMITNTSGTPMRITKPVLTFTLSDGGIGLSGAKMMLSCDDISYTEPIAYAEKVNTFDVKSGSFGCSTVDGNRFVYAKFQDSLGNLSASVKTDTFLVHTAPIVASILTKPDALSNVSSPTFTVGGLFVTAYKYKLDSADYSAEIPVATPFSLSGLSDGSHIVSFIAKDDVGVFQSLETATTYSWTIDTAPPQFTLSGVPQGDMIDTSATITLSGSDVVAYKYSLDDSAFGAEILAASAISLTNLTTSRHTLRVIARDSLGNYTPESSAVLASWNVVSPPAPAVVAPPAPVVSSGGGGGGSSGGGSSGGGGGGGFSAPAPVPVAVSSTTSPSPLPIPSPLPAAPESKKGIVLGAKTVNLTDGLIIKVEGRGQYFIIQKGIRRPIPYATYRKKYFRKSSFVSLPLALLKGIPRR